MKNEYQPLYPAGANFLAAEEANKIILFRKRFQDYELVIKPFSLQRDIALIHRWVNQPYARRYWQMQGPVEQLYRYYETVLNSGAGYSLMVFLEQRPVAQVDVYDVMADEIGKLYEAKPGDHGIHVLMAPNRKPVRNLSTNVMVSCLAFLFTLSVNRVIGEPDAENEKANALVKRVGFRLMKQVKMSYKTANLYSYRREDFLKEHP